MLKKVGFWRGSEASRNPGAYPDCPDVNDYVDKAWDETEKTAVLRHMSSISLDSIHRCRGMSRCRICGKWNGSADCNDGVWRWPDGFYHYIKDHDVKPPQEFIDHCLA